MPQNDRVYYSVVHMSFQPDGNTGAQPSGVHGVQSATVDTTYTTENVRELGQLEKYDTKESNPEVRVTVEKVLDGLPLIYHASTSDATDKTLNARCFNMKPTIIKIATFPQSHDAASGNPLAVCICSGQYIDSLAYRFQENGPFAETVGFIGSSKIWATGASATNHFSGQFGSGYFGGPAGPDTPASGVEVREDLDMTNSRWPTQLHGITGGGVNTDKGTKFDTHINSVEISANIGRTDLFELGRRKEYYKTPTLPVVVTTNIGVITNEFMDVIDAKNDGTSNVNNQTMRVRTLNNYDFYLGTKNTIRNVSWQGSDVNSNAFQVQFSYENENILTITAPQSDPKSFPHV